MLEKHWHMLRAKRNKALEETDKYMLSDFPITAKEKTLYREYREYLRNLPNLYNDDTVKTFKVKSFKEFVEFKRTGLY